MGLYSYLDRRQNAYLQTDCLKWMGNGNVANAKEGKRAFFFS